MTGAARDPVAALIALRDLATAAHAVDPSDRPAAVLAMAGIVETAIRLLGELQDRVDAGGPSPWAGVADVCFAGRLELNQVQRVLAAGRDPDELAIAIEAAHRKLRRAIRAVLETATAAGAPDILGGPHQGRHVFADLASALVVRRLYAGFRRELRRPDGDGAEAVLVALRYAAGAIATMTTAPDYGDVRAADRAILRNLHQRLVTWARGPRDAATGRHLLADVWTCADLLRGINKRQELRAHDAALIAALVSDPAPALPGWWARLEALIGLDDQLDAAIAAGDGAAALTHLERLR